MAVARKKFERKLEPYRREALITATLALIARDGIDAATVRAIADEADVTPGLIRHYFTTKEDLISAAYEKHMSMMTDATDASQQAVANRSPLERLAAFVQASLSSPVVGQDSVGLWAGFLYRVRHDPKMRTTHRKTYIEFRGRLEKLIIDVLQDEGIPASPDHTRRLAIACNAVIDGLWLEGGALPEAFRENEVADIGLRSIGAIIGMSLMKE